VELHGIRSGRGARAPSAPPLDPSLPTCYATSSLHWLCDYLLPVEAYNYNELAGMHAQLITSS
jgi:hypothetical protein